MVGWALASEVEVGRWVAEVAERAAAGEASAVVATVEVAAVVAAAVEEGVVWVARAKEVDRVGDPVEAVVALEVVAPAEAAAGMALAVVVLAEQWTGPAAAATAVVEPCAALGAVAALAQHSTSAAPLRGMLAGAESLRFSVARNGGRFAVDRLRCV